MSQQGRDWLDGKIEVTEFGGIKLNDKQIAFVNDKHRFSLISGGMSSGKTLAWMVKFILITQWFPGTRILIGRKTKMNAQETFMKDFSDICPKGLYEYKLGDGKLIFSNGTEAIFFGLDASVSGEDTKKAEQNIKSHNFGFIFIDQLEEIEKSVFDALNSRARKRMCRHPREFQTLVFEDKKEISASAYDNLPELHKKSMGNIIFDKCSVCGNYTFNQFNMTTNPANFWGYHFFKESPHSMSHLIETSMLDNKKFLSEQFIQSELTKSERYIKKFVYGEWSDSSLVDAGVFSEEDIAFCESNVKKPIREFDGIKIFEDPSNVFTYQIGVDTSEGNVDPSAIKVFNVDTGEEVASYTGFVPVNAQVEKTLKLAYLYSQKSEPLIVVESSPSASGAAFLENIKNKYENIYQREVYNYHEQKITKKLGFSTNSATKQLIIDNFNLLLNKKCVKIRDENTVKEMRHFVWSDEASKKGAGAQAGYHDDEVMATMLAIWRINPSEAPKREEQSIREIQRIQRVRVKKTNLYA